MGVVAALMASLTRTRRAQSCAPQSLRWRNRAGPGVRPSHCSPPPSPSHRCGRFAGAGVGGLVAAHAALDCAGVVTVAGALRQCPRLRVLCLSGSDVSAERARHVQGPHSRARALSASLWRPQPRSVCLCGSRCRSHIKISLYRLFSSEESTHPACFALEVFVSVCNGTVSRAGGCLTGTGPERRAQLQADTRTQRCIL
jgi:hypothetical protein